MNDSLDAQHHWRLFFDNRLKDRLETLVHGTALAVSSHQATRTEGNGNHAREWGGMYLRSEAEVKIVEQLDQA